MKEERLVELRTELDRAGYVVTSRLFWEVAADAIRYATDRARRND